MLDFQVRFFLERENRVRRERIADNIGTALTKFECAGGGVGHDGETDARHVRLFTPVIVVAFDDNLLIRFGADEAKRAGPDRMLSHFIQRPVGNDAHGAGGEIPEKSGKRLFQAEDDGVVVGSFKVIDVTVGSGAGGADLAFEERVEGPLYVARGEGAAIVKFYVVAKVEDVGERIGNFPALGESGRDVEMIVAI